MSNYIKKPKTTKAQVDTLWDIVCNHIMSRLKWQDVKLNFILAFLAILMGLVTIVLAKGM